ncbi:competence/damage-inducible protein CinA [Actibacterium atlanticum]|uniref:Competence/damage-inducible protein CinA n=1 Tax=Actibacterium atlanticum TaxID=1461693 RepID=A0A058ZRB4_9RHOB|nr:CinA family protein [Actibacterium atlanticum]KCV83735.1 competence/damage-inducible protein CinA [Actibacterium atlanticum]
MTYGPAQTVLELAREAGVLLAAAESCTGGLIGGALTEVAGSSDVFDRGFITYSNAAKMQMLGVKADTLRQFGAVSEQVAQEMALGALRHSRAGLTVAVTGIAGPGGSDHKPEGRVCFGIANTAGVWTETQEFGALGRENVRRATVEHALGLLEARLAQDSQKIKK